jgi:hypothetical protein
VLHGARIGFPCMVPARFRMLVVRGTAWWVSRDAALSPRFSFRFLLFDSGSSIEFASGSLGPLPGLFGRHEWRYRLAMGIRIALLLLRVRAREREREREKVVYTVGSVMKIRREEIQFKILVFTRT